MLGILQPSITFDGGAVALCSTAFVAPTAQTKSLRATRVAEARASALQNNPWQNATLVWGSYVSASPVTCRNPAYTRSIIMGTLADVLLFVIQGLSKTPPL